MFTNDEEKKKKFSHLYQFYFLIRYEPELHPGVTFKMKDPKATLKIFSTGSVTVTGKKKYYFLNNIFFIFFFL